ncbi:ROK family protein [Brevibacterium aurantiacum]|uniref:ROK family protein n=1 Tax=Brevibacterium aurantiacum TaxID=273384 RepID=UPI0021B43A9A|nr:ROK family protein [Brevibacterium aurantiacum]
MTSAAIVAVDVGGTKIRAGSVIDGVLDHLREVPTPAAAGARAILDSIAEVVRGVISDTDVSTVGGPTPAWKVGIGSAGVIDPESGTVVSATDSLSGWAGTALTSEITERLGVETRAVNDVHAHALGEALSGAACGTRSSLLVAAGTGIGGGFITDNRLLTGRQAAAGHIGHVPVAAAQGLPCPCGGQGHLEAIASGPAVLSAYRRAIGERSPGGPQVTTTRELAEVARSGDPSAKRTFEQAGRALGTALGGVANVLSPEVIVIGGGLSGAGELWWIPLREAFAAELIPAVRGLPLRPAQLGQDAALIGAASLWSTGRGSGRDTISSDTYGTTMTTGEEPQ